MNAYNPYVAGRPSGYAAFPNLQDYYRVPNQGYAPGPKLLDNIVPAAVPTRPTRTLPQPGETMPGYRSFMQTAPTGAGISPVPPGYEQYLLDPFNGGQMNPANYRNGGRGYRRIRFNGREYYLPPGVAPPEGYIAPPSTNPVLF